MTPPRPRSPKKRDLPANLYEADGLYQWRHPITKSRFRLGRDKRSAIEQALEANLSIEDEKAKARLVDRLTGEGDRTFGHFVLIYEAALVKRKLSAGTLKERSRELCVLAQTFGGDVLARITTLQISAFLDAFEDAGKARMAQVYRSTLLDFFRLAQAKGWIDANPAEVTDAAVSKVRRSRLTLATFRLIYAQAQILPPWVANSIALALVTAQRRADVATMRFVDVRDGWLWVAHGKTGAKVRIPLELRLAALNWSVEDIICQCRDNVLSPYLIHSTEYHTTAKPGDKLHTSSLSKGFAQARDMAKLKAEEGTTPPSFHELRSLAERLYAAQGIDTQTLLGHKSPKMTAVYHDSRGSEWLDVVLKS